MMRIQGINLGILGKGGGGRSLQVSPVVLTTVVVVIAAIFLHGNGNIELTRHSTRESRDLPVDIWYGMVVVGVRYGMVYINIPYPHLCCFEGWFGL